MLWRNRYRSRSTQWPMARMWQGMPRLRQDMDYLSGGTSVPVRANYPALNVWSGSEGAIVTAEIAGVNSEGLDISVEGDTLTVSGERIQELPEGGKFQRHERGQGEFSRAIKLPFHADADNVTATFQHGILQVELPRLPEEKPKKIEIRSA